MQPILVVVEEKEEEEKCKNGEYKTKGQTQTTSWNQGRKNTDLVTFSMQKW